VVGLAARLQAVAARLRRIAGPQLEFGVCAPPEAGDLLTTLFEPTR
jgi:hypothetical protein